MRAALKTTLQATLPIRRANIDERGMMILLSCAAVISLALLFLRRLILGFWKAQERISGFPSLPDPHPIFGDLPAIKDGIRRCGGISIYLEELGNQLGPNFQLRVPGKRFVHLFLEAFLPLPSPQAIINTHADLSS